MSITRTLGNAYVRIKGVNVVTLVVVLFAAPIVVVLFTATDKSSGKNHTKTAAIKNKTIMTNGRR